MSTFIHISPSNQVEGQLEGMIAIGDIVRIKKYTIKSYQTFDKYAFSTLSFRITGSLKFTPEDQTMT